MKSFCIVTLSLIAGILLGAIGVQALHAQNKPPPLSWARSM